MMPYPWRSQVPRPTGCEKWPAGAEAGQWRPWKSVYPRWIYCQRIEECAVVGLANPTTAHSRGDAKTQFVLRSPVSRAHDLVRSVPCRQAWTFPAHQPKATNAMSKVV